MGSVFAGLVIGVVLCIAVIVGVRSVLFLIDEWLSDKTSLLWDVVRKQEDAIFRLGNRIDKVEQTQELHANKIYTRGDVVTNKEFDIWSERIVAIEEELERMRGE